MVARWSWLAAALLGLLIMLSSCVGGAMMLADVVDLTKLASAEDQKFLQSMAAHYEEEVEMCQKITEHGHSAGMQEMASAMLKGHGKQLDKMKDMHRRMFGDELVPNETAHMLMDMSMMITMMKGSSDMPMMDGGTTEHPQHHPGTGSGGEFDKACLEQMIPHHNQAISMAEAILSKTQSAEMRAFATELIEDQAKELQTLRELKTQQ